VDARVTPGHANGKYDTCTPFLSIGPAPALWRRASFSRNESLRPMAFDATPLVHPVLDQIPASSAETLACCDRAA
jgi:hypothetical protein